MQLTSRFMTEGGLLQAKNLPLLFGLALGAHLNAFTDVGANQGKK